MTKTTTFFLLVAVVFFSSLELGRYQAAILFILVALTLAYLSYRQGVTISPVVFVIVAYVAAYPFPALFPALYPNLWISVPSQDIDYAMLWSVRGFSAYFVGYVLVEKFAPFKAYQHSYQHVSYGLYIVRSIGWLALLAWLVMVMLFGFSLVFIEEDAGGADRGAGTLVQILFILSKLRYPYFLCFLILYFSKQTNRQLKYLFAILLSISIVEIISAGSKGSVIRLLVVGLLAMSFLPVKLGLKQLLIGVLSLIMIYGSFTVITEYRSILTEQISAGRDVFDFSVQAESFGHALYLSLPFSESATARRTEVGYEEMLSRFGSGMFSFAGLLKNTYQQPPYENFWENFLIPIYSITPRALFPEKPEFFHAGRNAREYYGWGYGGIAVTLLGSLYFAWGYAGIISGMAFLGGVVAYVTRQARVMGVFSPQWLILLVILLLPLLDVGATHQNMLTNFSRVAILLWLVHLLYPLMRNPPRRRWTGNMGATQRGSRT